MSEESKQPEIADASDPGQSPPSEAQPPAKQTSSSQSDTEKNAVVEDAKARVVAAKEAAAAKPTGAQAAPKPPVKRKEEGPKPIDASDYPLVKKLKARALSMRVIFLSRSRRRLSTI